LDRLPIPSQSQHIREALESGKHVLSEKPIAADVQKAEELISWYRNAQLKVSWGVAESNSFYGPIVKATEKARGLGKVTGFQVRMHSFVHLTAEYFSKTLSFI
jgi:predicted dehydrogenase